MRGVGGGRVLHPLRLPARRRAPLLLELRRAALGARSRPGAQGTRRRAGAPPPPAAGPRFGWSGGAPRWAPDPAEAPRAPDGERAPPTPGTQVFSQVAPAVPA